MSADVSAEVTDVLAKPLFAVVGLNRPDAAPQLTVVWYEWDGSTFRFSTTRSRAKFANIRRDPAISLLVNDPDSTSYVVAYGRAEVEESGHAELSRRLFARYLPGTDPGDRPTDPDRVVIAVTPERILAGR
jgi:PPOX class probable F420-dependent enzyme